MHGNRRIYLRRCCRTFLLKTTRADSNHDGHIRKMIGESALSSTCSETSKSTEKRRKRYVDHPKDRFKPIFLIYECRHSLDECKDLGEFGSKYSKRRPTKDRGQEPEKMKKFNRKQENISVVHHAVDEIILQENNKLS